jgi:hypothetical protein
MRIGELLLEQRKIRQSALSLALDEQKRSGRRLVSMLIEAGVLEFDDASRALGEQRGVPCVLEKHLAALDPELAKLVPAELARSWCVLPIGRTSGGALIVCARDPDAQLAAMIEKQVKSKVTLVISPAARLEGLVGTAYGEAPHDEFDVDLGSALLPAATPQQPPMPDMSQLDPETIRLALTDLDDVRVAKDDKITMPPANAQRGGSTLPPAPPSLDATRTALDQATSRDAATDAAMKFVAGRWRSGLVLALRGTSAVGYRGHGPAIGSLHTISVSLADPSTVQRAIETRRTSIQLVNGSAQDELSRRLGTSALSASPVLLAGQVVAVIAVGEPIHGLGDTERTVGELGKVSQMLGAAYERLAGSR